MGPTMSPIKQQQNSNAPSGTSIALLFGGPVPELKADDIKKILAPVLDFDKETATDNYVEKLPEPIQNAIKANKVIVGMDRDQVSARHRQAPPQGTQRHRRWHRNRGLDLWRSSR